MPEWKFFWSTAPKEQIIYTVQVVVAYAVIGVSLVNLCVTTHNAPIWATLLSGCIGYLFPAPSLDNNNNNNNNGEAVLHPPA